MRVKLAAGRGKGTALREVVGLNGLDFYIEVVEVGVVVDAV